MLFNLNENVRVKLTDTGKEIMRKKHTDLVTKFGSVISDKSKIFTLPPEDENGYSQWKMWQLFSNFGEHIYMGCEPPFDLTIEIPDSKGAAEPRSLAR